MPRRLPTTTSVSTLSPTNIARSGATPTASSAIRKIAECGLHGGDLRVYRVVDSEHGIRMIAIEKFDSRGHLDAFREIAAER